MRNLLLLFFKVHLFLIVVQTAFFLAVVPATDIKCIVLAFLFRSIIQVAAFTDIAIPVVFISTESTLFAIVSVGVVKVAANQNAIISRR